MNCKVSVIMPVYNAGFYLEDALDSVLNQTLIDSIEILMIDDGSTDDSRYIIDKYALDYDNFHAFHKKNEGPAVARNYGLNFAKGEYVHFMDSDDYLIDTALEKMYYNAIKFNADYITANFLRYNDDKLWPHTISDYVFNNLDNNIFNTNLSEYHNLIWDTTMGNKLYKKEFLDNHNIRFYEDKRVIFEDNIFSTEVCIKAKSITVLKDIVYCWRQRKPNKSISQYHDVDRGIELFKMAEIVNEILLNNINDKKILSNKYMKLLLLDIPFYMEKIKNYSKEEYSYIFEGAYRLASLIPDEYFDGLNNYYKTFYEILRNKDWDNLSELLLFDLKRNPEEKINIDEKYYNKFNFKEDSKNENLSSYASKIHLDGNNLVLKLDNHILYHSKIKDNELYFRIKNNKFNDILIESNNFNKNELIIPVNLINFGENIILAQFKSSIEKECVVKTGVHESFKLDEFIIDIHRDKFGYLKIYKRHKSNEKLIIDGITIEEDIFKMSGFSNQNELNILILKDYFNFNKFEYDIRYDSNNKFFIEINFWDLLKSPIKKWELLSGDLSYAINVTKKFKLYNEKYLIIIKNQNNKIILNLKLYDTLEELNKLSDENYSLKRKKKQLKKENKKLKRENSKLNNNFDDSTLTKVLRKIGYK